MPIQISSLGRSFTFKKDGKELTLHDPNPEFTADEVMNFYSNTYPELTTATVHGPEIVNDQAVYSFKTTVGTKG